jgi:hypothetical protein
MTLNYSYTRDHLGLIRELTDGSGVGTPGGSARALFRSCALPGVEVGGIENGFAVRWGGETDDGWASR